MPKASRDFIVIFINGQRHNISKKSAFMMLADFLRYELKLVGTKIVCAEGDCGACTVLCCRSGQEPKFVPINACIAQVSQLDGCHILTVEGLKQGSKLSEVQCSMVKNHASQCGFCTPGFVMAISGLLESSEDLTEQKVKNALTGNLCRCTGYQPIINSVLAMDSKKNTLGERYLTKALDQELLEAVAAPIHIIDESQEFYAPLSIADAVRFKASRVNSRIIGGATDIGVWINKGKFINKPFLSLHLIKELYEIKKIDNRVMVGARASLASMREFLKDEPEIKSFLNIFASPQIKNVATLVGNIANGSSIGDTIPFMMVADGLIHVAGEKERTIAMEDLYTGYKTLSLLPHEIITHASFELPKKSTHFKLYKTSQRKDLDISTINAAFWCELKDQKLNAKLSLGGVSSSVVRLKKTEEFLWGKAPSAQIFEQAISVMQSEITPLSDLRGSSEYRRLLCQNLLRDFFAQMDALC
jgi:xanthine dehydrogenase small subunit